MIGYASRTGTLVNLAALRTAHWGLLVCASTRPASDHRTEGFENEPAGIIVDNGAAKIAAAIGGMDAVPTPELIEHRLDAWRHELEAPFELLAEAIGPLAQSIIAPDIVGGGLTSLALSRAWLGRLDGVAVRTLLPVQDGMIAADVEHLLGPRIGIFVGGSAAWKWRTLHTTWGPLSARVGCWLHVGRTASNRAVERCGLAGADSFDSSLASRYKCRLPGLDNAKRQIPLFK